MPTENHSPKLRRMAEEPIDLAVCTHAPAGPVVLIPRDDATRAVSETADAVDAEWVAKLRKLAADFDRKAKDARARSLVCPKSHADGWLERMETYRKCAAEVRRLLGE